MDPPYYQRRLDDFHKTCLPHLRDFKKTAYQFGYMQGAFLAGTPLPNYTWLDTSSWLRSQLEQNARLMPKILDRFKTHPLTSPLWKAEFGQRLRRIWSDRKTIFEALEQVPHSLCHGDFCYGNLIARPSSNEKDETVVIDWQYSGVRQIGSDIAGLISDSSIIPVRRKAAEPEIFIKIILEGYMSGLQESGWKGDLKTARFACLAYLAWPWSFNLTGGLGRILQQPLSEENQSEFKHRLDEYVKTQGLLFTLGDEAKQLLNTVR